MKILVAEDDRTSNRMLSILLQKWGHEVISTTDGAQAWKALAQPGAPQLAIFDWMMPLVDGPTLCRMARQNPALRSLYIILLTTLGRTEDIVAGLESGANDYVVKPFNHAELQARINVGVRMVLLQNELAATRRECREAQEEVKQLRGIIPICSYCKKIRDDQNYWTQVESYIAKHSEATFSHGVCPECFEKFLKDAMTPSEGFEKAQ